jgi:hypothetical protein
MVRQARAMYGADMSEIADSVDHRDRGGRFVIGGKAGPGRPKGARSKFSEQFIHDLASAWSELGEEVLQRVAREEPSAFLRTCALLMPRDVSLSVGLDAASFARTFQDAVRLLGNEVPPRRPPLPNQKVIEHGRHR